MYKQDLELNNLQGWIRRKTQLTNYSVCVKDNNLYLHIRVGTNAIYLKRRGRC